jgi:hypothetical protein
MNPDTFRILKGQAIAFFAFDVGYSISLDQITALLPATPQRPLSKKKQTPSYLQYVHPPAVLDLGTLDVPPLPLGKVLATVFDFGAISISYSWPLPGPETDLRLHDLPEIANRLYHSNLEVRAKEQVSSLINNLRSAISKPNLAPLVEDYFVFVVERHDANIRGDDLLQSNRSTIAQVLRFEVQPLSTEEQDEAVSQKISYYENDLIVIDWNSAFLVDRDYEDTVNVLELLNIELLEARYVDTQLDKRIKGYETMGRRPWNWPIPLRTPYLQEIKDLAELRIESSLLRERVDNVLKLVGDLYLSRVHSAAAEKVHLQEWSRLISHKLDIVNGFYAMLTDRVRTVQSQTMELIIVILILVELVLALRS